MSDLTCALGPDSAGTLVTRLIRQARSRLDVAVYEVGPSYAWTLAAAARRGVRVRLLLDAHASDGNASTAASVARAGGEVRVMGRGATTAHWKLLCADRARTALGSGNLIWRDAPRDPHNRLPPAAPPLRGTREWWLLTDDVTAAERAAAAVDFAWSRARRPPRVWREVAAAPSAGEVGAPTPQVGPQDVVVTERGMRLVVGGLTVGSTLERLVVSSRRRLLVTAPYVHAEAVGVRRLLRTVARAAGRGVDVRILLGCRPLRRDARRLAELGLRVRWMDPLRSTRGHAKGIVADGTVIVTSANWSSAGLGRNWEAALAVRSPEVATYFAAAWERDWAVAVDAGDGAV